MNFLKNQPTNSKKQYAGNFSEFACYGFRSFFGIKTAGSSVALATAGMLVINEAKEHNDIVCKDKFAESIPCQVI